MLSLQLLGATESRRNEQIIVGPASAKARALLYYLAMTQRAHLRSHLANLLWSDYPEEAARANLRKALGDLEECVGDFLVLERQSVGLCTDCSVWTDAVAFVAFLSVAGTQAADYPQVAQLQQALDLYHGDFLMGFYVRQAPDFEAWLLGARAQLRQMMITALKTVAVHFGEHEKVGGTRPRSLARIRPVDHRLPF